MRKMSSVFRTPRNSRVDASGLLTARVDEAGIGNIDKKTSRFNWQAIGV